MKSTLSLGLVLLGIGLAAGCIEFSEPRDSDDDDDAGSPTCTPPPAVEISFEIDGTGAGSLAGNVAGVRMVDNTTDTILVCTTTLVAVDGTFTLAGGATGPIWPHVELVLNSEAGPVFGTGDQHYSFQAGVDGTLSGTSCDAERAWNVPFDYGSESESTITWPLGEGCP